MKTIESIAKKSGVFLCMEEFQKIVVLDLMNKVQRWIPISEEEIPLNQYVNLKDDEGCILAFKFDSEVERTQLLRTNPATHWRLIELK